MNRQILSLLVLLLLALVPCQAQNKTKKQLEKERTQLEAEIKKLNTELANAKKNTKLTTSQLNALNKKINERNKLIDNINGQLCHLDSEISATGDSITTVQQQRKQLQENYAAAVRSLYREYNNVDKWVLLFDTPSYNKALLRTKYFKKYNAYRLEQSRQIRDCESRLQEYNAELQRKRSEQSTLLQKEQQQREQLTKEQKQKEASVQQSKKNEKQLSKQLSAKEAQKRKLQQQIQRMIDEEVRKAAEEKRRAEEKRKAVAKASTGKAGTASTGSASGKSSSAASAGATTTVTDKTATEESALSNDFASNKGKLAWPVAYTSITRNYGRYTHESGGQNMNNGIDLLTVQGTNVYAVFNGTVSRTFTCPNGTLGIIIRHGDYMTVYANMATCSVKSGQKVKTRAVIGTVASDGEGHGEFSFQLWNGKESQNPRSWLR